MYKQCRTEQSAARQRVLLEGLQEAMLQQHFDEISVSDLCQQMQIPRKSFYRYFSSKEGALNALIDQSLLDFETFSHTGSQGNGSAQEDLERLFSYWIHKRKFLDALAKSNLSGVLVHRAIGMSTFESMNGRRFLPAQEQKAQEYLTLLTVTGFLAMVIQWHHDGYPQTVQQMADISLRLFRQPLPLTLLLQ